MRGGRRRRGDPRRWTRILPQQEGGGSNGGEIGVSVGGIEGVAGGGKEGTTGGVGGWRRSGGGSGHVDAT